MISDEARRDLIAAFGPSVCFQEPLDKHTSLGVGGPAEAFVTPLDRKSLQRIYEISHTYSLPLVPLGKGFNTLVREGGVSGIVLRLGKFRQLRIIDEEHIYTEAGVSHVQITQFCERHGLSGLEFGAGSPGNIGGWITMNAGIPDAEIGNSVESLEVIQSNGTFTEVTSQDLQFRYRSLAGLGVGGIVVAATLSVHRTSIDEVQERVRSHLSHRAETQPLDRPSCGSIWKNPPGDSAGRLIEQAEMKGLRVGGAEISKTHANFIVNLGDACAEDILRLMELTKATVQKRTGIVLEPEVRVIGQEL